VRWGGLFAQLEFTKGNWTAFLNLTSAMTGYQRIDYFRKKDLILDGNIYKEAIGYSDIFYYNGSQNLTYSFYNGDKQYTSNDTTFVIKYSGSEPDTSYITNASPYDINSSQSRYTHTAWKWFPGFTAKGGVNYNIDARNNMFMNLGYLSKAPRFANVFDNSNAEYKEIRNERIQAFELGYSYNSKKVALNVNGYLTFWQNKPLESAITVTDTLGNTYPANVNGIDAFHKGFEIEFGWKPIPAIQWDQVVAIGDWRWTSGGTAYIYDEAGNLLQEFYFNAKGVHVGDAAQVQFMESIRWEIIKYLYVSGSFTLFAKNYSDMEPSSLSPIYNPNYLDENGKPRDSWMLPVYYLIDLNAGYRFTFKRFKLDVRATVLNVLDRKYIADAVNNDSYSTSTMDFDAASAGVFFGLGRTFNVSLALSY